MTFSPPEFTSQQRAALEEAYRETLYEVFVDEQTVVIRVGVPNSELARLMQQYDQISWALITAWNPYSQVLSEAKNEARNVALEGEIQQLERPYLKALGKDPLGEWLSEESFFMLGIGREDAIALGKKFEQNAILYGSLTLQPQLIWLLK
ncbi:MAG: DUF3293 domain-containing protein [Phormidesmis sp.]